MPARCSIPSSLQLVPTALRRKNISQDCFPHLPGRLFSRGDSAKRIFPAGFALGRRGCHLERTRVCWAVTKDGGDRSPPPVTLRVDQLMVYNFHCPVPDVVHPLHPLHLIVCFEFFGDAFLFGTPYVTVAFATPTKQQINIILIYSHFSIIVLIEAARSCSSSSSSLNFNIRLSSASKTSSTS